MTFNLEQCTKDFIRDVKKYLGKSTFEPIILSAVYKAIDSHEADIKDAVRYYVSLAGIEDGMIINVESEKKSCE